MEILPAKKYPPVGSCIYCGTKVGKLGDEHIVPFGLGGNLVLPKASCRACEKATGRIEGQILRSMLGPFRIRFDLPTRRPKERPHELEVQLLKSGRVVKKRVPATEIPFTFAGLRLPPPRILLRLPPTERLDFHAWVPLREDDIKEYAGAVGEGFSVGTVEPLTFLRFLAKIAHSFAVAQLGQERFDAMLPDIVLGKPDTLVSLLFQLIGGGQDFPDAAYADPSLQTLHRLQIHAHDATGIKYILVSIQLFSFMKAPTYFVVAGKDQGP